MRNKKILTFEKGGRTPPPPFKNQNHLCKTDPPLKFFKYLNQILASFKQVIKIDLQSKIWTRNIQTTKYRDAVELWTTKTWTRVVRLPLIFKATWDEIKIKFWKMWQLTSEMTWAKTKLKSKREPENSKILSCNNIKQQ